MILFFPKNEISIGDADSIVTPKKYSLITRINTSCLSVRGLTGIVMRIEQKNLTKVLR